MWQSSWIHLWTLTSLFCSMSRLAGQFLLRKITKHISLYFKKVFEKARKIYMARSVFMKIVGLYRKKALTAILKQNLCSKQMRLNYVNSQNKETEKERLRLVISSIRVGVVAKTDDEVYVSSTTKMYRQFSFVFSTVPKKVQLLKISKVRQLLRKSLPPCKNGREEDNKFFGQSLLYPVIFQKRKYQDFCSGFGSCLLQYPDPLTYDCMKISTLNYLEIQGDIYLLLENGN